MTTPSLIAETLDQNEDLITHSGRGEPYGYVDWWPVSIAFNTSGKFGPYDNPDVRWAISFYLDRAELRELAYDGAAAFNPLTMPQYPPLQPYFDIATEVMEEIGRSTLDYDPDRGDELMEGAGFTKNSDGMWEDSGGNTINCENRRFRSMGSTSVRQLRSSLSTTASTLTTVNPPMPPAEWLRVTLSV